MPVARLPDAAREVLTSCRRRIILLFSTETARHFMRLTRRAGLLDELAGCEAITIGSSAAMALSVVPWARMYVAAKPTQDEMLALLR